MLQSIWDVLDAVFLRFGSHSVCMEKLCRCYKHTAKNCRDSFGVLVPKLLQQITSWYEQQPHSCFVYVINWLLTTFSRDPQFYALFVASFRQVSQATFQLLSVKSTISDNPDVVEDYFELCAKVRRLWLQVEDSVSVGTLTWCTFESVPSATSHQSALIACDPYRCFGSFLSSYWNGSCLPRSLSVAVLHCTSCTRRPDVR